ncbi:hypothetical protein BJD20_12960 [Acinetobacter proteolyticus]|uniref:hypothetical protein n=1 Tax=Acinetobacter proteolyticus TaxID=1776741 RepID=UPI000863328C|nr:hypothetical protein [Acinetobacter proteolyticus]OEY96013.1 hypothetical protein BJD20_12960 [Acinetobacter proteolyticus]
MNNILNAQDAFAALQKGKNLLCRFKDSDFMELDQFPATVFGLPDYEFCIDIEKIELSGFKFTKPYELDELVDEQDIFVIDFTCSHILKGKYNSKNKHLIGMVENGLVQRSIFDAESQIRAFHNVIGVHNGVIVRCEDFTGKPLKADSSSEPKQTRKRESKKDAVDPQIEHNKDLVIDAIATCLTIEDVEATCFGLDKNGFNASQLDAINAAKLAKLDQLAQERVVAESQDHELFNQDKLEPELSVLCDAFVSEINNANSKHALNEVRRRINSNDELSEVEHAELATRINIKLASFEETKLDDVHKPRNETGHYFDQVKKETAEWNEQLQGLLTRLQSTKSPEEANALVSDTKTWTEDQRQPLLRAISRRLQEFQNPKPTEQPSLAVQIQNAPDLTTLDALEIDVSSLDVVIQPEMLRLITTRRLQLENAANNESQAS